MLSSARRFRLRRVTSASADREVEATSSTATASRLRGGQGPAILSYGFRPFFLAAAIYAGIGIGIWLPLFSSEIVIPTAFSPVDWHIHEMLYGFLPGVIAGFLLTAIPNWTGRPPLRGASLAVLVAVWMAGRVAVFFSAAIGQAAAGVIDVSFLLLMAAVAAREVIAGRNWRNLPPVLILLTFFAGNVVFHVEDHTMGMADVGLRLGVAAAIALISLIGGRVIPSFTRNWLARANPGRLPVPFGRFDVAAMALSVLALAAWVFLPQWPGTTALLLIAGIAQTVRLCRWAGDRTWRNPLVLVMHVGYAFVPLGFLLVAGANLFPQALPASGGIHAWTAGAIGVMTLAIMTRVSLGHTGRPLAAGRLTQAIYVLIAAAAVIRIAAAFAPDAGLMLLHAAAGLWVAAFWAFALGYGPLLWRPRADVRA
jgi:uncharacterized protein involved in response to NO